MAEIIGIVASSISITQLAAQVSKSVMELKNLWGQVKELPSDIDFLMRQVESLELILSQMQDDLTQKAMPTLVFDNICVKQSLKLCKEGADKLGTAVSVLADDLKGKTGLSLKMGSIKVMHKKEKLQRLKAMTQEAINMLSLAYQCHTAAMIRVQPVIIIERLSTTLAPLHETIAELSKETKSGPVNEKRRMSKNLAAENLVTRHYTYWTSSPYWLHNVLGSFEYKMKSSTQRQEISTRYRVPAWISNRVWECGVSKTLSRWRFDLQISRVLPFEHPLFRCARSGDVMGIQNLLTKRQVCVTDRQLWTGSTALHIAASRGHKEACKLLISEGADVLSVDFNDGTPLHKVAETAAFVTFTGRGQAWDVGRLLINAGASNVLIDDIDVLERFEGPKGMFKYLQQQVYPPYYSQPMCERFAIVEHLSSAEWHNTPDLMRLALCSGALSKEIALYSDKKGQTLLHHVARGLANTMATVGRFDVETVFDEGLDSRSPAQRLDPNDPNHAGRQLAREVINAGACLHTINHNRQTPLCSLIKEFTDVFCSKRLFFESLLNLLNNWLCDLYTACIDLEKYGNTEKALHLQGSVEFIFLYPKYSAYRGAFELTFTCGPHPDDWIFSFSEHTDNFAGRFRATGEGSTNIECSDEELLYDRSDCDANNQMPGSWIEAAGDLSERGFITV